MEVFFVCIDLALFDSTNYLFNDNCGIRSCKIKPSCRLSRFVAFTWHIVGTGVLLVAFGVASAMSPAGEKYLTVSEAAVTCSEAQSELTGLEGVAEGQGKMQVRALTGAEEEVREMEAMVSPDRNK